MGRSKVRIGSRCLIVCNVSGCFTQIRYPVYPQPGTLPGYDALDCISESLVVACQNACVDRQRDFDIRVAQAL